MGQLINRWLCYKVYYKVQISGSKKKYKFREGGLDGGCENIDFVFGFERRLFPVSPFNYANIVWPLEKKYLLIYFQFETNTGKGQNVTNDIIRFRPEIRTKGDTTFETHL